ncbi:hypothetical protein ACX80E_14390 [Arthrobacter sp. TMN-49]
MAKVNRDITSVSSSSLTSDDFTENLKIELTGFDNKPTLTFPWEVWVTPNNQNPCPSGDSGSCRDQSKFSSSVSDQAITKDGLSYRLVIEGFVPTSTATCPATMASSVKNDFWANEGSITGACICATVVWVRQTQPP